jgi:hypothetical protein
MNCANGHWGTNYRYSKLPELRLKIILIFYIPQIPLHIKRNAVLCELQILFLTYLPTPPATFPRPHPSQPLLAQFAP